MLGRGRFGFGRGVFVRQLADVMAFAGAPENHRHNGEPGAGFAKIESHKVGHTKRRELTSAREKAVLSSSCSCSTSSIFDHEQEHEHDYELKGNIAGLL